MRCLTFLSLLLAVVLGVWLAIAYRKEPHPLGSAQETTSNWQIYKNTRFGFQFRFPPDFVLTADPDAELPGDPELSSDFIVGPSVTAVTRSPEELEILAYARKSENPDFYNDPPGFWQPRLENLIPVIHRLVSNEQTAGSISTTTIAGRTAFEFTVDKGIGWNGYGRVIDEENWLVFMESTDTVFQISLPNAQVFNKILRTFEFNR